AGLAGDEQAFALIVGRYQAALLKAAISRMSRRELAEEAVQETFLSAHRWLATYDSRYSFRTWLWTILLKQCSRQAKREAKQTPLFQSGDSAAGRCETDSASTQSPLSTLLARESSERLHELLARLPAMQADALR